MIFVKLKQYPYESYSCVDWSDWDISIIGYLFTSDLGCPGTSLDNWIFDDDLGLATSGNSIELEKEDNHIYLTHMYDEKKNTYTIKNFTPQSL